MIGEVSSAISGLKGILDIAKGMKALSDETKTNEIKLALQEAVLKAQRALFAAQEGQIQYSTRIAELEQENLRLKDWSVERGRYHLTSIRGGGFAYMPKSGKECDEPAHWLCANCFSDGRKSIMQNKGMITSKAGTTGNEMWACDACKGSFAALSRSRPVYPDEQG